MINTIFLVMFLLFALIFGKLFCGKVCPIGYLQEWLNKIPFPVKISKFMGEKWFVYLKYVFLAVMFILPFFGYEQSGHEHSSEFSVTQAIIWGIMFVVFIIVYRPFCKFLCPYGALMGVINLFSPYRYRIDGEKCINCDKCAKVCKMNVNVHKTPNHPECLRCGKCRKACPKKAICAGVKICPFTQDEK
ncbi:MAG: 4Fe-4S binding protein [Dysgonamonadaceae bacterium]|nr:4Fe-4S binding protein [Dysgonamonadaceae bacterium]